MWRWIPGPGDFGHAGEGEIKDVVSASLEEDIVDDTEAAVPFDMFLPQEDRDRALSLLLSVCQPSNMAAIASGFLSNRFMEKALFTFLRSQRADHQSWFHVPTFRSKAARSELLLAMIGYGTYLMPPQTDRHLGALIPNTLRRVVRMKVRGVFNPRKRTILGWLTVAVGRR